MIDHGKPGYMSRDCTLFADIDGNAYFISAANENRDLHVYQLSADSLSVASLVVKLWVGQSREAPGMFKRNGYYFLITSGCTGWSPNQQKYSYSTSIANGWSSLTNLGDGTTYDSQNMFDVTIQGSSTTSYLFMGDRWAGAWGGKVNESEYVWLPLTFSSNTSMSMPWTPKVSIDTATGQVSAVGLTISSSSSYNLVSRKSHKVAEVPGASTADNTQLDQYPYSKTKSVVDCHGRLRKSSG